MVYIIAMNGQDVGYAIKALCWSQQDFADRLGVQRDTVSRWVRGDVPVPGYVVEYLRVLRLAEEIIKGKK